MMLRLTLIGYLGSDAERRSTQKGSPLVEFRVAVNQVRSRTDGQRQESAEWFRVRVMGRQIDYAQHLAKGTRVFVAGRLDISHFQSTEGERRTAFEVWADEVQSLTLRPGATTGAANDADPQTPNWHGSPTPGQAVKDSTQPVDDDELPF